MRTATTRTWLAWAAAALFVGGCAGYRLGTTLPPGIVSLHVPTFVNETGEPQLEIETTRAVLQEFQKDGALRVVAHDDADAVLSVKLERFVLEPLRYERNEVRATSEYRIVIIAWIEFTRVADGEHLTQRRVRGEATFEPAGDIALGKLDALPDAAEDLAHQIVETVVEYW